jgi:hypothetical protein
MMTMKQQRVAVVVKGTYLLSLKRWLLLPASIRRSCQTSSGMNSFTVRGVVVRLLYYFGVIDNSD